jgi:mRNA interferase HicA
MKRTDLIRRLTVRGCVLLRRGRRHDVYVNPRTRKKQPVPRHREIDEHLAKHILTILS